MSSLKLLRITALAAFASLALLASHGAMAKSVGVIAMFKVNDDKTHSLLMARLDEQTKILGCALRREGNILGRQGDYELKDVNAFFLLECENMLLKNHSEAIINQLKKTTKNLMLVEGPMSQFGEFGLSKPGINKSYIIKLSDYNNEKPLQREQDLGLLSSIAKTRKNHYNNEAFVRINNAYGMARPDEAVVIFYNTPQDGPLFRSNNQDLMAKIGAFNQHHLSRFSYIAVSSNR